MDKVMGGQMNRGISVVMDGEISGQSNGGRGERIDEGIVGWLDGVDREMEKWMKRWIELWAERWIEVCVDS